MEYLFVPYEIALEMKLLEFDEPCFGYYVRNTFIKWNDTSTNPKKCTNSVLKTHNPTWLGEPVYDEKCSAPTFAQCFKFFREKYSMPCKIEVCQIVSVNEYYYFYQMLTSSHIVGDGIEQNLTYEEAELACVTELINIVKNKKP